MSGTSTQQNQDSNTNSGYVGEIEASLGEIGLGTSTATASSSASGSGVFTIGDKNVASGRSSTGTVGLFKSGLLVVAGLIALWIWRK